MGYGRSPWTEVGMFDRETRSYVVDRIPKPPEAKAFFEDDHLGQFIAGHELKVGCPKCFNQVIVRWQRAYSDNAVESFRNGHPEIMAVCVAKSMTDTAARAEREKESAQRREGDAMERALWAEAAFKRIQIKRSDRARRKRRKRRPRSKR
jgi:hypothetical protein